MNIKELSQLKEKDVIYDESLGITYIVTRIYKSGILAYCKWANFYGRFTEDKFLKNEELLCKDMIIL